METSTLNSGIHGPKPIGSRTGPGPQKFKKSRTSSDQDRENFRNPESTRTRTKISKPGTESDQKQEKI